ncbi:hypothetical protein Cgig2_013705 [Carnegiea gigantea]|uniref:Uncharacterized protein n=1 Tax=Carnegiea gigantea TaxID=171969 RepID=A0A9Q1K5R0_9CARY|nr:hypothetical protein Cgig2_013705 [Carnegiea gigantea]
MEAALKELERVQTGILERIAELERAYLPDSDQLSSSLSLSAADDATAARLSAILRSNGVRDFTFKSVPSNYYDRPLKVRRDLLGAASIHHLCKSIVLVCHVSFSSIYLICSIWSYSVDWDSYTAKFSAEMVKNYLYLLNEGKVPKKKFNSE